MALIKDEFVNMNDFSTAQFDESVTVTVYNPPGMPVRFCRLEPLLQEYVYEPVPPVTSSVIDPSATPLHDGFDTDSVTTMGAGAEMVSCRVRVFPLASVIVTLYIPAERFCMVGVMAPVDQA